MDLRAALKRVPFAHAAYALWRLRGGRTARFTADYQQSSGVGSDLVATERLITELPPLLHQLSVHRLLDIPCGDFVWMQQIDLGTIDYIGADLIESLIQSHRERYASPTRTFQRLDLVTDALPPVDAILCRDCLVHCSARLVKQAVNNLHRSGATYLIATTFPEHENRPIVTGHWRPINLCAAPFHFPKPVHLLYEGHPPPYGDKALGVWRIADVPSF